MLINDWLVLYVLESNPSQIESLKSGCVLESGHRANASKLVYFNFKSFKIDSTGHYIQVITIFFFLTLMSPDNQIVGGGGGI